MTDAKISIHNRFYQHTCEVSGAAGKQIVSVLLCRKAFIDPDNRVILAAINRYERKFNANATKNSVIVLSQQELPENFAEDLRPYYRMETAKQ